MIMALQCMVRVLYSASKGTITCSGPLIKSVSKVLILATSNSALHTHF